MKETVVIIFLILLLILLYLWQFVGYEPIDSVIDKLIDEYPIIFFSLVVTAGLYVVVELTKNGKTLTILEKFEYVFILICVVYFIYLSFQIYNEKGEIMFNEKQNSLVQ